ncbi:hypothetical protein C3943_02345 [Lysinibacillus sp. B2A1]|nr:hypothetical protein C3943_02345 [Lysinibacillus sp. B2A1]
MKISKIFTGLVVCSALIFPGALSSSAQEINPLNPTISVSSYPAEQPTWKGYKSFNTYQGSSVPHSVTFERPAPYAPAIYSGWLTYSISKSSFGNHVYEGILYLSNPIN